MRRGSPHLQQTHNIYALPRSSPTSDLSPFFLLFFDEQALTKITGLPAARLFSVASEGLQRGNGGCLRRPSIGSRCTRARDDLDGPRWYPRLLKNVGTPRKKRISRFAVYVCRALSVRCDLKHYCRPNDISRRISVNEKELNYMRLRGIKKLPIAPYNRIMFARDRNNSVHVSAVCV